MDDTEQQARRAAASYNYGDKWLYTPKAPPRDVTVNHGLSRKARRQGYRFTSRGFEVKQ